MLLADNRIKKQKDFDNVFKCGRTEQNGFFVVRAQPNQRDVSRFGFVISSRVAKRAVARNRLKRQLNEIVGLNLTRIKNGIDVVVVAKPKSLNVDYRNMEKILLNLLGKFE